MRPIPTLFLACALAACTSDEPERPSPAENEKLDEVEAMLDNEEAQHTADAPKAANTVQ